MPIRMGMTKERRIQIRVSDEQYQRYADAAWQMRRSLSKLALDGMDLLIASAGSTPPVVTVDPIQQKPRVARSEPRRRVAIPTTSIPDSPEVVDTREDELRALALSHGHDWNELDQEQKQAWEDYFDEQH